MNQAAGVMVAFGIMGIIFLGFFLIVPQTYSQLDATDLGAVGNSTLDDAYGLSVTVQRLSGVLILAAGGLGLAAIVIWAVGRLRS